ncbi:MAG: DMT family transporter [Pseudomonadota bacterium]|nr:DMT family transporter [Pseudomonadota bacterium]
MFNSDKSKLLKIDKNGDNSFIWPFFLLIISQIFFGSNQIMGRLIEGAVPPIGLSFWRWTIATLVVLPFTFRYLMLHYGLIFREWRIYLCLAFSLIVLGNTTIYIALNYTTAINASIVSSVQPAVTFVLSWLLFSESVTKGQLTGAFIATLGVLYVISRGDLSFLMVLRPNPGDLWMIISVIGFSFYNVLLRKLPPSVPYNVHLNVIQFLGIILLLPVYLWETKYVQPMYLDKITISSVLWAGIVVAVAALGLWNFANIKLGANKASGTIHLRLIMITIMAIFILGERLQIFHFIAFAIIVVGIYLISSPRKTKDNYSI